MIIDILQEVRDVVGLNDASATPDLDDRWEVQIPVFLLLTCRRRSRPWTNDMRKEAYVALRRSSMKVFLSLVDILPGLMGSPKLL